MSLNFIIIFEVIAIFLHSNLLFNHGFDAKKFIIDLPNYNYVSQRTDTMRNVFIFGPWSSVCNPKYHPSKCIIILTHNAPAVSFKYFVFTVRRKNSTNNFCNIAISKSGAKTITYCIQIANILKYNFMSKNYVNSWSFANISTANRKFSRATVPILGNFNNFIGDDNHPWPLLITHQIGGVLSSFGGGLRFINHIKGGVSSPSGVVQGKSNQDHAGYRYKKTKPTYRKRGPQYTLGPIRHLPLGIQILLGALLIAGAMLGTSVAAYRFFSGGFVDTFLFSFFACLVIIVIGLMTLVGGLVAL